MGLEDTLINLHSLGRCRLPGSGSICNDGLLTRIVIKLLAVAIAVIGTGVLV